MSTTARAQRLDRIEYGDELRPPAVTIIIPTLDGERRGLLDRLLRDLKDQTLLSFEVILVVGDRRQGRAINRGVAAARAPIIVTMDDDTIVGTSSLLANLVAVLEEHPDVGLVGASTLVPPGASWFQRVASRQIPRRLFPIVGRITDSDMVQHPCLAMRRSLFLEVGGEDEELVRGLDPLLRYKVRRAGHRVVIAPHSHISHPLPDGLISVLRMYFRNGRGSAFAQKNYPERIYNLTGGFRENRFPDRVSFARRVLRYPARLLMSLVTLRWIRLFVEIAYLIGYARELTSGDRAPARTPATPGA